MRPLQLTLRGKAVLVAGAAIATASQVFSVRDGVRVGAILILLPVVAALVVSRVRPSLTCERRVSPRRVSAGQAARVELHVANQGRQPTPALLAEDMLPPALGRGPRFTFSRVEGGGMRGAAYTVPPATRGRYQVGPLTLRIRDAFGLAERTQSVGATTELIVTPQITHLGQISIGGAYTAGSFSGRRTVSTHGDPDIGTRPWREGDDLRRVHWRTTARTGELAVRREEQPWSAQATILLDSRANSHAGQGRTSSFEWAVSAAASIASHLGARGLPCRLITATGRLVDPQFSGVAGSLAIVDELATLVTDRSAGLPRSLGSSPGGVIVAVLGAMSEADIGHLLNGRGSAQGIALLLDTPQWATTARLGTSAAVSSQALLLRAAGWDVIVAKPDLRLDEAWLGLGVGKVTA